MTATVRSIKPRSPGWTKVPAEPFAAARDALLLLQSGRVGMATRLLERLPELIEAERLLNAASLEAERRSHAREIRLQCNVAYLEGRTDGARVMHRKLAPKPPPTPTGPRRLEWLREMLADPQRRETARAVLRLDDALLDRVAAGRAGLAPALWRRLRETLT